MLDPLDSDTTQTMSQFKLISQKNFIIEKKEAGAQFEDYNANEIHLKLIFWDPKVEILDFQPEEHKIKVEKKLTVIQFIQQIKSEFPHLLKMEEDTLNLVNKKVLKNGLIKGENLSMSLHKTLDGCLLNNNSIMYVDEGKTSLWESFFESENNKIIIQINYPAPMDLDTIDSKIEYGFKIKIDLNQKLKDLKNDIKKKFNISEQDDFVMKKGGVSGIELKDYSKPIRACGIINNSFIFLQFGQSIALHEIKILIFLCLSELSR